MHLPKKKKNSSFRPFHYTVVDAIKRSISWRENHDEIERLFRLIKETEILANQDAIIAALNGFFSVIAGDSPLAQEVRKTKDHILQQKKLAQKKSRAQNVDRKIRPAVCS